MLAPLGESVVRDVVSIGIIVIAGIALAGCARDPYVTGRSETRSGEWRITHQIDRVTGSELPSAYVFAEASHSNLKYPRVSSLLLTCLPGNRPLIRFAFDFKIGGNQNTLLGYRFDDLPGHDDVPIRIVRGSQIITMEDPDAIAQFIAELEKAQTLYVRIRSINGGRTAVEYPVHHAWGALRAAFARCGMPAPARLDPGRTALPGIY